MKSINLEELRIREVERRNFIVIQGVIGEGTKESPVREAHAFYDDEGNLWAFTDSFTFGEEVPRRIPRS